MEIFYLEEPTISRKQEAIDYIREHVKYNSDTNGTGYMDTYITQYSYEEWLEELEKIKDENYIIEKGKCHSKTFFLNHFFLFNFILYFPLFSFTLSKLSLTLLSCSSIFVNPLSFSSSS